MAEHRLTTDSCDRRRTLTAGARGRVLDIGADSGLDLGHYRPGVVSSVVALGSHSPLSRNLGLRRPQAHVPFEVHEGSIETAEFAAGSFDTVVTSWVFCRVDDPDRAAAAIAGWLKPNGCLLFLEHVRGVGLRAWAQRGATPLWARFAGCHLDRDTIVTLRRAGFAVTDCERFAIPAGGPLFRTCVQGVARPRPLQPDPWE
jgi:SAM-dependent methyltransferase